MRFQYAPLKSKPTMFPPINRARYAEPRPLLQRLSRTLCTPILKLTATSVTDVDPPNPWLCFARHHFTR